MAGIDLTVKKAARFVGVSEQRIRKLVKDGRLKNISRHPSYIMLDLDDVIILKSELADHPQSVARRKKHGHDKHKHDGRDG